MTHLRSAAIVSGTAGLAALAFASYAAATWRRYGRHLTPDPDPLLDAFMPVFDVCEHHHARIAAPAGITMDVARTLDFDRLPLTRMLAHIRAAILAPAGRTVDEPPSRGLLADSLAMGWGVLAEEPGRSLVMGAVCRPWHADPGFRSVPAGDFVAFDEPDYVKIVWSMRADPVGPRGCRFVTDTRVATTDPVARARFRRYWSVFSPGVSLIRSELLLLTKRDAERRARLAWTCSHDPVA